MEYAGKSKEIPSKHNKSAYIFIGLTRTQSSKISFDLYSVSLSVQRSSYGDSAGIYRVWVILPFTHHDVEGLKSYMVGA